MAFPSETAKSVANDTQIGGNHYKVGGEEHWDRVARLGLDYFQGQITKYVERWKKKGGLADLLKAQHVLAKYIELENQKKQQADKAAVQAMMDSQVKVRHPYDRNFEEGSTT